MRSWHARFTPHGAAMNHPVAIVYFDLFCFSKRKVVVVCILKKFVYITDGVGIQQDKSSWERDKGSNIVCVNFAKGNWYVPCHETYPTCEMQSRCFNPLSIGFARDVKARYGCSSSDALMFKINIPKYIYILYSENEFKSENKKYI